MGLLIKVISHEMGNALNVLGGALKFKDNMGAEFYSSKETVDMAFEGVDHALEKLIEMKGFIDKVSKGHELDREEFSIHKMIGFIYQSGIEKEAFEVIGDTTLSVYSNRYGLSLIVLNLLRNAVEVAKTNVQFDIREEVDCIRLEVVDDGSGLSRQQIDNLWADESTKSDETRVRGLGTQIVAFLCDNLSIDINVVSNLGSGTKFSLDVPK